MTPGLDLARVAEILVATNTGVERRGSGYRVTANAVLTAAHIVREAAVVRVRFDAGQTGREWTAEGAVVWSDARIDVAVVAVDGRKRESIDPVLFGRVEELPAVVSYDAVGFPRSDPPKDPAQLGIGPAQPNDGQAGPSDSQAGPDNGQAQPSDSQAVPSDSQAQPDDSPAHPSGGSGRPSDGSGRPSDGSARPSDGSGRPSDGSGRPSDGSGRPSDDPAGRGDDPAQPSDSPARLNDDPAHQSHGQARLSDDRTALGDDPPRLNDNPHQRSDSTTRASDNPASRSAGPARPSDNPAPRGAGPARPTNNPARPSNNPGRPSDNPGRLGDHPTRLGHHRDSPPYQDFCHLAGTIPVLSDPTATTLEIPIRSLAGAPDSPRSQWAGMAGAAVWSGGRIIGVVSQHGLGSLTAGRVDRWYDSLDRRGIDELSRLVGLPRAVDELVDVVPPPPAATRIHAIHDAHVRGFAPDVLLDRDCELTELVRFCAGEQPYQWWQGPPWAGKTALAAWFVLHPPAGVDVVSFFVTGGLTGQADSAAFDQALQEQLAALSGGRTVPTVARDGQRSLLLDAAAASTVKRGRRLLIVIDGLDEDQSSATKIASLLPQRLPEGVRLLVTSRPHPDVLADALPADHPLHHVAPRRLDPSPHAQDIQFSARQELTARLHQHPGDTMDPDIIGLIAASGGGLTTADLAELTGRRHFDVVARLGTVFGRSLRTLTTRDSPDDDPEPAYTFAHETLRVTAEDRLAADIPHYRGRIDQWADRYRAKEWPAGTPAYLLQPYARLLAADTDHHRLVSFSTDPARHDLMLQCTYSDMAAFTEITTAQQILLADPAPDLAGLTLLTVERERLGLRNQFLPPTLPAIWVRLGRARRGEALARSMSPTDNTALSAVAVALAQAGDWDNGERVARDLPDGVDRAMSLAAVAAACASADPVRAKRLAAEATRIARASTNDDPDQQSPALVLGAAAVALRTLSPRRSLLLGDEAEQMARAVGRVAERAVAMAGLAEVIVGLGPGFARQLVFDAAVLAAPRQGMSTDATWMAWDRVIAAMACIGQVDRAEQAARDARPFISPGGMLTVWNAVAAAHARAGNVDRALHIARNLADYVWTEKKQVSDHREHDTVHALCTVAHALVETDPHQAERLATEAEQMIRALSSNTSDGLVGVLSRRAIALTLMRTGRWDDAERIAHTMPGPRSESMALSNLAEALIDVDRTRAMRIAADIEQIALRIPDAAYDPDDSIEARPNAVSVLARLGKWDSAERITLTIGTDFRSGDTRAQAWAGIALAFARADQWQDAERTVLSIDDSRALSRAWAGIAAELARAGRWDDAERTVHELIEGRSRARSLCTVAAKIGTADPLRVRRLVASAVWSVRKRGDQRALVTTLSVAANALAKVDPEAAALMAAEAEQIALGIHHSETRAHILPFVASQLIERDLPRIAGGERESARERARRMLALAISGGNWMGALPVVAKLDPADASSVCDALQERFIGP
jgi:hypothetical protein